MEIDKLIDNLKENKSRVIMVFIIFIVIIVLAVVLEKYMNNYFDKKNLEKALYLTGEKVYKEVYYDTIKDDIEEYKNDGLKITLKDMFELTDLNVSDYFYNRNTKKTCDINNSYVIIIPKAPYKNSDYDLKFNLDCGY